MKHTKSMIYCPTEESRELLLYATNTAELYYSRIAPAIESLRKKAARGAYDPEKAADLFYSIATEAAKLYSREFSNGRDGLQMFNVTARFTCAVEMEEHYRDDHIFYDLETA